MSKKTIEKKGKAVKHAYTKEEIQKMITPQHQKVLDRLAKHRESTRGGKINITETIRKIRNAEG